MDAGKLILRVRHDGARIVAAAPVSRRTLAAAVLEGRGEADVQTLVPRLFSLCGRAQAHAARLALAAARGEAVETGLPRALILEAIGEHLWRLCLDWPVALGGGARMAEFRAWRMRLAEAAGDPAHDAALAADLLAALTSLRPRDLPADTADVAPVLLPAGAVAAWLAGHVADPAAWADLGCLAAEPLWQGRPAETGALARHAAEPEVAALLAAGRNVAARLLARLADLRALAATLADPAAAGPFCTACAALPAAPGLGLARVETARGLLLHLIQVNDGRVGRYVIVAPTEWNFHQRGAFVCELAGKAAATRDEAALLAGRLALALDPCVAYEVRVEDA